MANGQPNTTEYLHAISVVNRYLDTHTRITMSVIQLFSELIEEFASSTSNSNINKTQSNHRPKIAFLVRDSSKEKIVKAIATICELECEDQPWKNKSVDHTDSTKSMYSNIDLKRVEIYCTSASSL